jgi:hypothetical protein
MKFKFNLKQFYNPEDKSTLIILSVFIFILILIISFVLYLIFTNSGKSFVQKYGKQEIKELTAEDKLDILAKLKKQNSINTMPSFEQKKVLNTLRNTDKKIPSNAQLEILNKLKNN